MEYWIGKFVSVMDSKVGDEIYVTRPSILSNQIHTLTMKGVDAKAVADWLLNRANGRRQELVQDAFPQLSDEEREFLMSGITPDEWKDTFTE